MPVHERYAQTRVINARGTYTPLGVSRSPPSVRDAVGEALACFVVIDELQEAAGRVLSEWSGAEAGTVVHCASAGITLAVAACMTGTSPEKVSALPVSTGMANRVVLPAGHAVDYGHPIVQDIRLAGANPVLAGSTSSCSTAEIENAMAAGRTACLLLVSSRLVRGEPVALSEAVAAAHAIGVPAVIDGAAQDMRIDELLDTGADLVIVSAQKYLCGPTAGLVLGRKPLVDAVRAQEKGIGRAMKTTKEGILGALAAVRLRRQTDLGQWQTDQRRKAMAFARRADRIAGISASTVPDPAGMPFPRVRLEFGADEQAMTAAEAAAALRARDPSIWVMEDEAESGALVLELVALEEQETDIILASLERLLAGGAG